MKKILFIAYHFPPHGGAGVQRSLKFVKYLPEFGIEPLVLTGRGDTDQPWSPPDATLLSEVPEDVTVVRTAWPAGAGEARRAAEAQRFEVASALVLQQELEAVLVSVSPFADVRFAAEVAACCGVPWIADLRDPWALDEFQVYRTGWHRLRERRRMRRALARAALIIMNTPEAAAALRRTFPELAGVPVISITNGYDAADFPPGPPPPRHERFTIVHAGFLHAAAGLRQRERAREFRWLRRLEPGIELLPRSHFYLLQALAAWRREDPAVDREVRLILAGGLRPEDHALVERSTVGSLVRLTGYLTHHESLQMVREADLLFLPLHRLPPARRATIVPGKTYEYLATGRPILAALPPGDARDFVVRAGTGFTCDPDNVDQMLEHLRSRFRAWHRGEPPPRLDEDYVQRFERQTLARQLANALHRLAPTPASLRSVSTRSARA